MASKKVASAFATGIASGAGFALGTIIAVGGFGFWLLKNQRTS